MTRVRRARRPPGGRVAVRSASSAFFCGPHEVHAICDVGPMAFASSACLESLRLHCAHLGRIYRSRPATTAGQDVTGFGRV
jgi:hypothetical protein